MTQKDPISTHAEKAIQQVRAGKGEYTKDQQLLYCIFEMNI